MTCPLINSTFSVLANDLCYKSEAGEKNTLGCAVIENPSLQSANNNFIPPAQRWLFSYNSTLWIVLLCSIIYLPHHNLPKTGLKLAQQQMTKINSLSISSSKRCGYIWATAGLLSLLFSTTSNPYLHKWHLNSDSDPWEVYYSCATQHAIFCFTSPHYIPYSYNIGNVYVK